jgi:hypothetical protein
VTGAALGVVAGVGTGVAGVPLGVAMVGVARARQSTALWQAELGLSLS